MSDQTFYVLPSDPDYLPSPDQQRMFGEYFMKILGVADNHYVLLNDAPMLVGSGEVSRVQCPACGTALRLFTPEYEPSPHYAWFEGVRTLPAHATCQMPCCGARLNAIELRLDPSYPYARFAQGAMNPGQTEHWNEDFTELNAEVVARLEKLLGISITQLWVYGT